jgi:hypothetical protein
MSVLPLSTLRRPGHRLLRRVWPLPLLRVLQTRRDLEPVPPLRPERCCSATPPAGRHLVPRRLLPLPLLGARKRRRWPLVLHRRRSLRHCVEGLTPWSLPSVAHRTWDAVVRALWAATARSPVACGTPVLQHVLLHSLVISARALSCASARAMEQ